MLLSLSLLSVALSGLPEAARSAYRLTTFFQDP